MKFQMNGLLQKPAAWMKERMSTVNIGKLTALNLPYMGIAYLMDKEMWLYRHVSGGAMFQKLAVVLMNQGLLFHSLLPSFHGLDVLAGVIAAAALKLFVL